MRFSTVAAIVLLMALGTFSFADLTVQATTTLAAQTGNNTSAAPHFRGHPNGNLGAGNVSKLPIRSLLYPGADTLIYAHVVPWWGSQRHVDVGYNSQSQAQVRSQVQDMISRGIDGVIVDWYGPKSFEDRGTKLFLQEAESHSGFQVIVEIEHGAVLWGSCYPKCSATEAVIRLATIVSEAFFNSPSYARNNGRPVLMEFGMENVPDKIDWKRVKKETPGNPVWIHRSPSGFKKPQSGGAFAWLQNQKKAKKTKGWTGSSYLDTFYQAAKSERSMVAYGSVYKGFDDELASWSGGKQIDQHCGQTWLKTFDVINSHYSASDPLPAMQLVTWNDYEEGTALETGIDNCVNLSGEMKTGVLTWTIGGGNEETIDHFAVYVSTDGERLMQLAEVDAEARSLNIASFALQPGSYTVFVQAVGKPAIRNHMSSAIAYSTGSTSTRSGFAPNRQESGLEVSVTPGTVRLSRGKSTQTDVTLKSSKSNMGQLVLACSDLPAGVTCSFSPALIRPGSSPVNAKLTLSAKAAATADNRHPSAELFAFAFPGLGVLGMVVVGSTRRSRTLIAGAVLALAFLVLVGCGGGSSSLLSNGPASPGRYTFTVSAVSPQVQQATTATLVIE